ncbi:MAG: PD40 domain-containing protein [Anaerolineae bacterium]|nr:PD40 domain-containing protein [Anaerolineae bacterium]
MRDLSHNLEAPLTSRFGSNNALNWSPDGQQITYVSSDNQDFEIDIMGSLGQQKHPISHKFTQIDEFLLWSPNSQHILYTITAQNQTESILFDTVTGKVNALPKIITFSSAVWSPDSENIIYQTLNENGSMRLYLMDIKCFATAQPCEFKELAFLKYQNLTGGAPVWSPDKRSIVLSNIYSKTVVATLRCEQLIESCIDYYAVIGDRSTSLNWSPDSQQLALTPSETQIVTIRPQTGEKHSFAVTTGEPYGLNWSPDSRFISYMSVQKKGYVYVLDTVTGETSTLYENQITTYPPQWRPIPR